MKKTLLLFLSVWLLNACGTESGPWADFKKCATNACVAEALAVKDAFLQDPKLLLGQFQKTYEKGEDHVVGWLYILRDSVLLNEQYGPLETRLDLQQKIVAAAKPFEGDPTFGEMARSILSEIEMLALVAETEDAIALSEEDARLFQNLQGTWVSASDSKAILTITEDRYGETYNDEDMGTFPYAFFPKCPADCDPVAPTPCLRVEGQDIVCYTIVKADGPTLELSLISGRGNTLVYTRKK